MLAGSDHVFLSYSARDRRYCDELTRLLESHGLTVWFAPRDVPAGADYSEATDEAIESCCAFVVIVSDSSNRSPHVRGETQMAFSLQKAIFPVRFSEIEPAKGFRLFLNVRHWTDAFGTARTTSLEHLVRDLASVWKGPRAGLSSGHTPPRPPPPPEVHEAPSSRLPSDDDAHTDRGTADTSDSQVAGTAADRDHAKRSGDAAAPAHEQPGHPSRLARLLRRASLPRFWVKAGAIILVAAAGIAVWFYLATARVETTPSGLRFQVVEEGHGPPITDEDMVAVRFEMRVEGGPVVENTLDSGQQPTVLTADDVIPGFGEALRRMREGGTYQIWIPPHLAYGETVPPGAPFDAADTLQFRVEVIQVARGLARAGELMNATENAATNSIE